MPAYFETGFSVRQPMWHGMGSVLDEYPVDWNDARDKAGLTWEPMAVPAAYIVDSVAGLPAETEHYPLPDGRFVVVADNRRAIVRDDRPGLLGNGFVTDQHSLFTHSQMGEIWDALEQAGVGLGKRVLFETAGSIQEGAHVWGLAYVDEPYTVAGDDSETYPFLAMTNAHDGTGALKVFYTHVRIVCWNTYSAALSSAKSAYTFRHVGDLASKVEECKQALAGMDQAIADFQELARGFVDIKIGDEELDRFVTNWEPTKFPAHDENLTERQRENTLRARKAFKQIYLDSVTTEAHRGTGMGLLDTATEFLDYVAGGGSERSFRSSFLGNGGGGKDHKAAAVKLIQKLA